eukprot:751006-Hanusia_phi.AAC.1
MQEVLQVISPDGPALPDKVHSSCVLHLLLQRMPFVVMEDAEDVSAAASHQRMPMSERVVDAAPQPVTTRDYVVVPHRHEVSLHGCGQVEPSMEPCVHRQPGEADIEVWPRDSRSVHGSLDAHVLLVLVDVHSSRPQRLAEEGEELFFQVVPLVHCEDNANGVGRHVSTSLPPLGRSSRSLNHPVLRPPCSPGRVGEEQSGVLEEEVEVRIGGANALQGPELVGARQACLPCGQR